MAKFFAELKRRQMFRVAAAYAVVAWLLLQIVNNVAPGLNLPNWAQTLVIVLLAIGFPIALIFAWIHQLAATDATAPKPATTKLDYVLAGGLILVIALASYQQLVPSTGSGQASQATIIPPAGIQTQTAGISIAVLPFVNLSADQEQEFFSDGMTEEITSALARVPGLIVIGRTSAFEFKGQNRDLRMIGQALGTTHLIEGSVRKAGNRVRISAQLIRADSGAHLWAENYDRELTDIFAIQEDIAQAIAKALRVPLGLAPGERLVPNRTQDSASYTQYLRARALFRARALDEAIAALKEVLARDSEFAPAWALLPSIYRLVPAYNAAEQGGSLDEARRTRESVRAEIENAAKQALRLDPKLPGGHLGLAVIEDLQRHYAEAQEHYERALALDPNDPETLDAYSQWLPRFGYLDQSLRIREQLLSLEPLVPAYSIVTAANMLRSSGRREAALSILEANSAPGGALGAFRDVYLARILAAEGHYAEAADKLLAVPANQNRYSRQWLEDAARLLRVAPAANAPRPLPDLGFELQWVFAHVGASDHVLEMDERALALDLPVVDVLGDEWSALRKTQRYKAFVRSAGFVDLWRAKGWPDFCRPMGADDFVCD